MNVNIPATDFHCPKCGQPLPASVVSSTNAVEVGGGKTKVFKSGLLGCPRCLAQEQPIQKSKKKKPEPSAQMGFDAPAIRIG